MILSPELLPLGTGLLLALVTSRGVARRTHRGPDIPLLVGVSVGTLAVVLASLGVPLLVPMGTEPRLGSVSPAGLLFPAALFLHLLAFVALLRGLRVPLPELVAAALHLPAFIAQLLVEGGVFRPGGLAALLLAWMLPPAGFMVDLPSMARGSVPAEAWKGALRFGVQVTALALFAARLERRSPRPSLQASPEVAPGASK